MRVFLILGDLPTNYASGTTAFFAVVGIDHFWVGHESIHRVNLVGKTFQLSKPLSLVHAESFGGSLPFPLDIFFSHVRLLARVVLPFTDKRKALPLRVSRSGERPETFCLRHRGRHILMSARQLGAMLPRCFNAINNFSLLLTQHLSVLSNHSEKLLYEWKTRSFDAESRPCGQRWTWNRDNTRRARQSCAYRCGRRCPHWVDQRTCWGRALANEHLGGHRQV